MWIDYRLGTFEIQKCEIIGWLIAIGHEKQLSVSAEINPYPASLLPPLCKVVMIALGLNVFPDFVCQDWNGQSVTPPYRLIKSVIQHLCSPYVPAATHKGGWQCVKECWWKLLCELDWAPGWLVCNFASVQPERSCVCSAPTPCRDASG